MRQHLRAADFQGLAALAGEDQRVAETLMQHLYDAGDLLYWRALEGLGQVARAHPRRVRRLIGRLLWLLNEDSGSFGWGAAAALGEIARHRLSLVEDIIPMFCGFLEEPFSRGPMLWGIGRLAGVHPETLWEVAPFIVPCLRDADPQVRGLAAWCAGRLKIAAARQQLAALLGDAGAVCYYDEGVLRDATVGELARQALAALGPEES
ncbi:MAG: hypothetical protein FJ128_01995 [Deltaproteobacteria bacterium]|nr:hypothetical protein [Deltaproteobacteria bacterium]